MKELKIINEQDVLGKQFKVYGTFDEPLFLAKDVGEWIEHSNPRVMLQTVDEDEKVVNTVYTLGGNQETWFLTENGLYEVLMQSRKPIAKQFKKEVKKILKTLRQTGTYTLQQSRQLQIPFTEIVQSIDIVASSLKINDASKILMYDKLYSSYGVSTEFLPKYENNGSRELNTATELLEKINSNIKTAVFNQLLIKNGYLEERTRKSTKSDELRYFKALTEKGLEYGENLISPRNQREVQPCYYADTFQELYNLVNEKAGVLA